MWVEALGGWYVLGRPEASAVLRDHRTFTVDDPRFSTARVVGPSMLSLDGDEHTRHRAPFADAFLPDHLPAGWEGWLGGAAAELIAGFEPGGVELRTAYAGPLASSAIVSLLALRGAERDEVLSWYRDIVAATEAISAGVDAPPADAAVASLRTAVEATIDAAPRSIVAGAADSLDAAEVAANVAVIMFGAIETGEGTITNVLHHILGEPGVRDVVERDPSRVGAVIDESLRLEPAAGAVHRYATRDATIGGVGIAEGDFVSVSITAANRDPSVYADPDRFVLDRAAPPHLAFAVGPHTCIGIHLARLVTRVAVSTLLAARPDIVLDEDESTPPSGLIFRKPRRLRIRSTQPIE